jgi:hypothetical protein
VDTVFARTVEIKFPINWELPAMNSNAQSAERLWQENELYFSNDIFLHG